MECVIAPMRQGLRVLFNLIETRCNRTFGEGNNPFYHLGDLGFHFFYILFATGVYLFFFYESTVEGSYDQLQYLSREQWYLGGVMRSLHRYAADAMALVMGLHLLREFALDRYRGARWFPWLTGTVAIWLLYASGIVGFWLVWDKMGQLVAVRTAEWLDWLPIFAEPMARNFLTNADVTDLLFRLLIVIHIGLPLFMLFLLLTHVKRISKARILPPRRLTAGTLAALLVLSAWQPTLSHARANLSEAPHMIDLDWFYMFLYPLMDVWSMGAVWALVGGITLLLFILPWLPPMRRRPAAVNLDYCSGCGFCAADCPYEAIAMRERSDGHPHFHQEAAVNAEYCVECGICAGACPSSNPFRHSTPLPFRRRQALRTGIDLTHKSVDWLRRSVQARIQDLSGSPGILIIGCDHGVDVEGICPAGMTALRLPCIGMLPPAFVEYALRNGADGVFLSGCGTGDCRDRFGNTWTEQRLQRMREPFLRHLVPLERIQVFWGPRIAASQCSRAIDTFRRRLMASDEKIKAGEESRATKKKG